MGKQKGVEQKIGTVGGLTYYRSAEHGYLVRKKSNLDKKRVAKDPAFEKSRKSGDDFGRASAGCHLMRNTMRIAKEELGDKRSYNRLTRLLNSSIITTDTRHAAGERTLTDADLSGLVGFEWNEHRKFGDIYRGQVKFAIDAKTGLMEVDFTGMNGPKDFDVPKGATHVQLVLEGGGFDFSLKEGVAVSDASDWLTLKKKHPVQTLSARIPVKLGMRLVLCAGIRFGQESNGLVYELNNQQYNGLVIGAVV